MNNKTIKEYVPENASVSFYDNVAVFKVPVSDIKRTILSLRNDKKLSIKLITATDERATHNCFKIWYVFGIPKENMFLVPYIELNDSLEFPSIALSCPEAFNYERKIRTFFGLTPKGHPDLRPLILHENWPEDVFPLRKDFDLRTRLKKAHGKYKFQKVEGEGVYEIPVGPIHAGIIEPGHFRFSVAGESIMLLEPKLGFTHKGTEKLFESMSLEDAVRLAEKVSGDSSFSHCLAFCQAVEQLADIKPPKRAQYLRVVYAELERLANHISDIGAIMLDAGFNFGGAQGARLREMIMRINERLTGSRFLRGVNTVGGVKKDIAGKNMQALANELDAIEKDFSEVIGIAENSLSLINRLENTGIISNQDAVAFGITGIAAKAVSIKNDARIDYSYAAYGDLESLKVETEEGGDVYARFRVRVKEVMMSLCIIKRALRDIPDGPIFDERFNDKMLLKKNAIAVNLVEGWRGEIAYFIVTDAGGRIARVVPRDPSFLNWAVLGKAGTNNIVPDFPLINKSFNLSYTGNDL